MKAGNISIDLELNGNQFTVQVKNTSGLLKELRRELQETASATKRIEEHYDSFGTHLRHFMLTAGSVRFALMDFRDVFLSLPSAIVQTSGELQRMQKLMEGLSTAATDAGKALEATRNMSVVIGLARNAPFDIKSISDAFVKLKSGGIDPTNGSLKTLIDGVAKFGGTSDTLHRASIALMQMSGKGVISMEELRQQLGEAIPNAMQLMADGAGISMAELVQKVSKGTVEAKNAIAKMFVQMEIDSNGAAEKMMETIPGALSRLTTSWELFKNEIGKQGFTSSLRGELERLTEFLDSPKGVEFARELGQMLESIMTSLMALQKALTENWELIKNIGEALFLAFAGSKLKSAFAIQQQMWEKQRSEYQKQKQALADMRKAESDAANQIASRMSQDAASKRFDAEAMLKKANVATQEAGKLYAEAHSFLNKAEKLEETVPGWAGKKVEALRAQAEGYKQVTTEIQQNAVAMRQRATELQKEAARIDAVAAIQRKIAEEIANGTRAVRDQHGALAGYASSLTTVAGAKQRLATAAGIAGNAILGFGRSLLGMVGWGIAVQGAFAAISWGYDKIFGSAKRAADEMERVKRIKQGESTKDDLEQTKSALADKKKELADAEKSAARFAETYKGKENTPTGKAFLDKANARVAKIKSELSELEANAAKAERTIRESEDEMAISSLTRQFDRRLQKALSETGIAREKQELQRQITEAGGNKKLLDELLQKQKDLGTRWISEKKKISSDLISQMEKEVDGKSFTKGQFSDFKSQYYEKQAEAMERQSSDYSGGLKLIDKKGAGGGSPVSGLAAHAARISADLEVAKQKWQNVLSGSSEFSTLREQAEEEIKRLLDEGKLNAKLKGKIVGKATMDSEVVQTMVDRLTMRKLLEQATRELPNVRTKVKELNSESEAIMQSVLDGTYGTRKMEREENKLLKTIAEIEKRSPQAAAEIKPLREEIERLMSAAQYSDATKGLAEFVENAKKQSRKVNAEADLLYATEEGARKAKNQAEIEELTKQKDKILALEGLKVEQRLLLEQSFGEWKAAVERRQTAESMTQVERLAKQWGDVTAQMNQATANWANKFMDSIAELVNTGKTDFRSLVTGLLKDINRINLQSTFGGIAKTVSEGIGEFAKGVIKGGAGEGFSGMISKVSSGLKDFLGSIAGTSKATNSLGDKAGESAVKLGFELAGITSKMTAEQAATSSLLALAAAASKASMSMGGSGGGAGGSGGLFGDLMGFMGLGNPGGVDAASWGADFGSGAGIAGAAEWFANGGIMTEFGSVSLRKYANGGIAKSPQLALYGEGAMAEAYVPLPDGRSIPVTMSGAINAGTSNSEHTNVTIQINVTDSGSDMKATGGNENVWKGMADKVRGVVQDELATQRRPGGMLYR